MADDISGIPLSDVISSLASTVVAANQHLDQASVDLRNLYLSSGNTGLANIMPSRFTLDEVTIELAFVVTETKPQVDSTPPDPPRPVGFSEESITLTANQSNSLDLFLIQNTKDDSVKELDNSIKGQTAQLTNLDVAIKNTKDKIDDLRKQQVNIFAQREQMQKQVNILETQIATLIKEREQKEQELRRATIFNRTVITVAIAQLNAQTNALSAQQQVFKAQVLALSGAGEGINQQINGLSQQVESLQKAKLVTQQAMYENKALIAAINNLNKDTRLTPENLTALNQRKIKPIDYADKWKSLYKEYKDLCNAWDKALLAFKNNQNLAKMPDYNLDGEELVTIDRSQKISDSNIRQKIVAIKKDYDATVTALNELVRLMIARKNSGVKVRIDQEALKTVPPEARQKIKLSFHGQTQENVKVDGKDIEIAK